MRSFPLPASLPAGWHVITASWILPGEVQPSHAQSASIHVGAQDPGRHEVMITHPLSGSVFLEQPSAEREGGRDAVVLRAEVVAGPGFCQALGGDRGVRRVGAQLDGVALAAPACEEAVWSEGGEGLVALLWTVPPLGAGIHSMTVTVEEGSEKARSTVEVLALGAQEFTKAHGATVWDGVPLSTLAAEAEYIHPPKAGYVHVVGSTLQVLTPFPDIHGCPVPPF